MQTNDPAEAAAILAVIEEEARAFWMKDFDAFAACWLQEPWIMRAGWWERGGITWRPGWEAIATALRKQIAENPEPNPAAAAVRRENIFIRVVGDMAWMTFDQLGADTGEATMDMPGLSHETRVLEKRDGRWRIAYMSYLLT